MYANHGDKLSRASPLWIDMMSTCNGYGHGCVRKGKCVTVDPVTGTVGPFLLDKLELS